MRLDRRNLARLILLVCVTLLVTRIAGNHVHLCFDGSEPPMTLHTLDVDHGADAATHDDQDIELPSASLAKLVSHGLDAALVAALVLWILPLLAPRRIRVELAKRQLDRSILDFLKPPLRGPPALLPC